MVLYPNKLPESERVCSGICTIIEGVRFDYLLVDSWFTCTELLKFIVSRHFGCILLE